VTPPLVGDAAAPLRPSARAPPAVVRAPPAGPSPCAAAEEGLPDGCSRHPPGPLPGPAPHRGRPPSRGGRPPGGPESGLTPSVHACYRAAPMFLSSANPHYQREASRRMEAKG
jgi:hypothetical protein